MTVSHDEKLRSLILRAAKEALENQSPRGSFPAGHNGPYYDSETPVRNTAYWLYTLSWLCANGFEEFCSPACLAARYLLSAEARPMGAAFWCRTNPEKDFSNGLVGQAWVAEALLYASKALDDLRLRNAALEVLRRHKWSSKYRAWHILNVDGSYGPLLESFNQQLWFAALAARADPQDELKEHAKSFLGLHIPGVKTYRDNVIFHQSSIKTIKATRSPKMRDLATVGFRALMAPIRFSDERVRSIGYHSFIMVALSYLKDSFPGHPIWQSRKLQKLLSVAVDSRHIELCKDNKYCFSYNPVGFEYAYSLAAFGRSSECSPWLGRQLERYELSASRIRLPTAHDEMTGLARIYEGVRYLDSFGSRTFIQKDA